MKDPSFSRRAFLRSTALGVATTIGWLDSPLAWAAKRAKGQNVSGPHALSRQDWPPAIVPDHIGVDKGYCCFTDEFGRLAVLDVRKPDDPRNPPHVVAELSGLGKKVIDFKVVSGRGYGLVLKGTESGDPQLNLICINLSPITAPELVGQTSLEKFADASCLTAFGDIVAIGGMSQGGENLVAIYSVPRRGRQVEAVPLSTWSAGGNILKIDLQDRNLVVLESNQLEYVGMVDPHTPELRGSIKLEGEPKSLARFKDFALVSGTAYGDTSGSKQSGGNCLATGISLEPSPRIVSQLPLESMNNVLDSCAQKDRFLVLGEGNSDRFVASIGFDKSKQLRKGQTCNLPRDKGAFGAKSSIVFGPKSAYVASGWAGIQVLNSSAGQLAPSYTYTIPRLPASGIATWGDRVVIAGGDLKLYDIAQPERPTLLVTTPLTQSLRSIVGAGSFVLCLSKDTVSLRKMENLDTTVASCAVIGHQVCYDAIDKKAYVLREQGKKSTITKLKVYSNEISTDGSFELPASFVRASASGTFLAVAGLNDINLYNISGGANLVGSRHFENLAVRDLVLRDNCIIASAVDQRQKGFLLVLSRDQKELRMLGSLDLPHDAAALAADKSHVVVVGKTADGKDQATIVDISALSLPKIIAGIDAIEAASAVVIREKVAIVAGRGIEILSL